MVTSGFLRHYLLYQTKGFVSSLRSDDLIAGFLAGILSKTATLPLDVVRKRLQVQGPHRNRFVIEGVPRYAGGLVQTAGQIVRHEGPGALFKGMTPSILKAGVSSAITFYVVAECRYFFNRYNLSLAGY